MLGPYHPDHPGPIAKPSLQLALNYVICWLGQLHRWPIFKVLAWEAIVEPSFSRCSPQRPIRSFKKEPAPGKPQGGTLGVPQTAKMKKRAGNNRTLMERTRKIMINSIKSTIGIEIRSKTRNPSAPWKKQMLWSAMTELHSLLMRDTQDKYISICSPERPTL